MMAGFLIAMFCGAVTTVISYCFLQALKTPAATFYLFRLGPAAGGAEVPAAMDVAAVLEPVATEGRLEAAEAGEVALARPVPSEEAATSVGNVPSPAATLSPAEPASVEAAREHDSVAVVDFVNQESGAQPVAEGQSGLASAEAIQGRDPMAVNEASGEEISEAGIASPESDVPVVHVEEEVETVGVAEIAGESPVQPRGPADELEEILDASFNDRSFVETGAVENVGELAAVELSRPEVSSEVAVPDDEVVELVETAESEPAERVEAVMSEINPDAAVLPVVPAAEVADSSETPAGFELEDLIAAVDQELAAVGAEEEPAAGNEAEDDARAESSLVLACDTGLKPESYSVKAYNFPEEKEDGPRKHVETGEESEPAAADELVVDEAPAKPEADPNELHLPLDLPEPAGAEAVATGELAGADVGGESVATGEATAPAGEDALMEAAEAGEVPEPGPLNRLSPMVEAVLSSALARPAPAINFSEALAGMAGKARQARSENRAAKDAAQGLPGEALEDNLARSAERAGGLNMTEYKVQFDIFEGPLDLLLYLVKRQEVDIYEVNLTQIASEFIKYIELMREFDLEIAGEFIVMAATLMYIKSRELLPVDQQAQVEGEEGDEIDPRWELIRQLVEYKKFKDAAADLRVREAAQDDLFPRRAAKPEFKSGPAPLEISVFDLLGAVSRVLQRFDARESREIFADRWTVSDKIEMIRRELATRPCLKFSELFEDALSRTEVVATFLALLELIRLKVILIDQPEAFADIEISAAPPEHQRTHPELQPDLPLAADAADSLSE